MTEQPRRPDRNGNSGDPRPAPAETRLVTEGDYFTDDADIEFDGHAAGSRVEVLQRQKEAYGGVKIGSAFFGWLTATAAAVLLTALVAAAGAAVGISTNTDPVTAANAATTNAKTVGISGAIILVVILFVASYCGGYVAGRMARFNGLRQGFAVWGWAIVLAIIVAVIAGIAGSKYDVLSTLNSFPRIPADGSTLTQAGIIALTVAALASLAGALLGGLAGMRFHRNVDEAGLET